MSTLKISHTSGGFFSCATARLIEIVKFYNENGSTPDVVDSHVQFILYKNRAYDNLIPEFYSAFYEKAITINGGHQPIKLQTDPMLIQFEKYADLDFYNLFWFVRKYFTPSASVSEMRENLKIKYNLPDENTCAVLYRGNDKQIETTIAPYSAFLDKAAEVKSKNPEINFLVQTDEKEFLDAFLEAYPSAIYFNEIPIINKNPETCILYEVPIKERAEYAKMFLATLINLSNCEHIITHSGNCGLWLALYRGNKDNIHQIYNNAWL